MTESPQQPLPSEMVEALLQTVKRRQQQGDRVGARVVLRALAMQQQDARLWLALASMAATRDEQIDALQQALTVEPSNPIANQALQRLHADANLKAAPAPADSLAHVIAPDEGAALAPTQPIPAIDSSQQATAPMPVADSALAPTAPMPIADEALAPTAQIPAIPHAPALRPTDEATQTEALSDAERARQVRWPMYVLAAIAVVLVACVAVWALGGRLNPTQPAQPTPTLPGAVIVVPSATEELATSTATDVSTPTVPTAQGTSTPAEPSATPTVTPSPTPPILSAGSIAREGDWQATLLRPDHMLMLEGAIGSLQPKGYFVLALMAVSNATGEDAVMPNSLFVLRDAMDQEYPAIPSASQAYLDVFGRGVRGDLSMIEPIPGNGGLVSVPVIFDVPSRTSAYTLFMGDAPTGWPLVRQATPVMPTATPSVPSP